MTPEQRARMEKLAETTVKHLNVNKGAFRWGFQEGYTAALESAEVQGLVKALKIIAHNSNNYGPDLTKTAEWALAKFYGREEG